MIALTSKYDAAEPLPAVMLLVAPIVPVTLAPVLVTTSVVLPFAVISTLPSITGILTLELPLLILAELSVENDRLPAPSVCKN